MASSNVITTIPMLSSLQNLEITNSPNIAINGTLACSKSWWSCDASGSNTCQAPNSGSCNCVGIPICSATSTISTRSSSSRTSTLTSATSTTSAEPTLVASENNANNMPILIGASVGGFVLLALSSTAAYLFLRRQRKLSQITTSKAGSDHSLGRDASAPLKDNLQTYVTGTLINHLDLFTKTSLSPTEHTLVGKTALANFTFHG